MIRRIALLLALALLAGGCAAMPGGGDYTVTAELERSFNVFPGSPVRVAGVDVGTVEEVVVPDGATHVEARLRVREGTEIAADGQATVIPESLIGERYVQLEGLENEDGATLEDGATIPLDRTLVPYEFDEVLDNLNQFVGGLESDEFGRMLTNFAEVLDGQGGQLGSTIDEAHRAVGTLADNDQELVDLASRLSDLNETLATRDEQLGSVIDDFDTLMGSLAGDRVEIDAALDGLVRVTDELARLLETNRATLEEDIATLTRVGRTAQRNLDYLSLGVLSGAELFRHAERIIDRERNWIPLQTQLTALVPQLTDSLISRLQGLCLGAGLEEGTCATDLLEDLVGGLVCAPPVVPCRVEEDEEPALPIEDALQNIIEAEPELGAAITDQLEENQQSRDEDDDPSGDAPAGDDDPDGADPGASSDDGGQDDPTDGSDQDAGDGDDEEDDDSGGLFSWPGGGR